MHGNLNDMPRDEFYNQGSSRQNIEGTSGMDFSRLNHDDLTFKLSQMQEEYTQELQD